MYQKTTEGPNIPLTVQKFIEAGQTITLVNKVKPYPGDDRYLTGEMSTSTPEEAASGWTSFLNICQPFPIPGLGVTTTFSGTKPDVGVVIFNNVVKVKSDNFKKECQKGIIVKHPYTIYAGAVRGGSRWDVVSQRDSVLSKPLNQTRIINACVRYGTLGPKLMRIGPFTRRPATSQFTWIDGALGSTARDVVVSRIVESQVSYPLIEGIASKFQTLCSDSLSLMDDAIITDTLAKANDKELDILTTLAELPKTVESLINGLKLMTEMTKAAKGREIQITKSYERLKKNHMKLAYRKLQHAAKARSKGRKPSKVPSFEEWAKTNEQKFGSETAIEILDAISGVWMNYRYNIRPLVYTMQDTVSAFEKYAKTYITARSKVVKELAMPEMDGHHFVGSATITHRCWIKRRYDVSDAISSLNNVLMADVFVTAYELIPIWSIVADWFFNIGRALRALPFKSFNYLEQGATYSVKVEIVGRYVNNLDPTRFNEVEYKGYKRQIISPNSHITIKYVNEFDNLKAFDSMSFAWAQIRRPIRNIPYRK